MIVSGHETPPTLVINLFGYGTPCIEHSPLFIAQIYDLDSYNSSFSAARVLFLF